MKVKKKTRSKKSSSQKRASKKESKSTESKGQVTQKPLKVIRRRKKS